MADTQPIVENTWAWSQTDRKPFPTKEHKIWSSPYEKFILSQPEAEKIVKEFEEFGGPKFWVGNNMTHTYGAEKETFIVSNSQGDKFAISRSSNEENREVYPEFERRREEKALREANYYFRPCKIVRTNDDETYVVRKFVEGKPATNQEMVDFERKTGIRITGEGNAVIDTDVGLVILDLGDTSYSSDQDDH